MEVICRSITELIEIIGKPHVSFVKKGGLDGWNTWEDMLPDVHRMDIQEEKDGEEELARCGG